MTEVIRTIADYEHFLTARLVRDGEYQVLDVKVSPLADDYNEMTAPVYRFLTGVCVREQPTETVEDSNWAWGEYVHRRYIVLPECTGTGDYHVCRFNDQITE